MTLDPNRKVKIQELQMKSGQYEAVQPKYKKLIGKSGRTWLIPVGKFAATNIHVSDPNPKSQGYGGATLKFNLEDGSILELKGPWHTGPNDLLKDTGLDIRDKSSTKVIIAKKVEYAKNEWRPTLSEILFEDSEPQESYFDRGTDLAKEFANKLGEKVFYYVETAGGSHSGWQKPRE